MPNYPYGNPRDSRLRPYVLVGGRTRVSHELLTHTLVSTRWAYDPRVAAGLLPEARAVYQRASAGTLSIAELSADLGHPLAIIRVLVNDLANADRVVVHPAAHAADANPDIRLLERLRDGLLAKLA